MSRVKCRGSQVEGKMSRVKCRGPRVKSRGTEKYEITLRIIFSCAYMDPSRFLAMFNDVLTSVY